MNIALLGPTGSGKGTLIQHLADEFKLHPINLGDVLREKASYGTALGLLTREYVQGGQLVPDEYVDAMVEEVFRHLPESAGTVLDGFPRTVAQARFLDDLLADLGQKLDAAVYLHTPEQVIFDRVARRLPARIDDEPHILRYRLHVFRRMVGPVLKHFLDTDRLIVVRADAPIREVEQRLSEIARGLAEGRRPRFTEADLAIVEQLTAPKSAAPRSPDPGLNLILLGGPGSGKGTQAEHLCKAFNLPHISTGDLFRDNIRRQTDLGRQAKAYMDRGELVPDDVTERMVAERLSLPDATRGFVLDGFPRTAPQAEALDEILHGMNRKVTGVIHLQVSDEEIIRRLSGRRICRQCQAPFHILFKKPRREGICNHCGGELYQRDDDKPETIAVRLRNYHRMTAPLVTYYKEQGVHTEVHGEGDLTAVRAAMLAAARLFASEPELVEAR
jgi:adenylate kinase